MSVDQQLVQAGLGAFKAAGMRQMVTSMFRTHEAPSRWWHLAACLDSDPDAWFTSDENRTTRMAEAVCAQCPVNRHCLAEGVLRDEEGIWGGLDQTERRVIRSLAA